MDILIKPPKHGSAEKWRWEVRENGITYKDGEADTRSEAIDEAQMWIEDEQELDQD